MAKVEINGKEFFLGKISWSGAVTKKKVDDADVYIEWHWHVMSSL